MPPLFERNPGERQSSVVPSEMMLRLMGMGPSGLPDYGFGPMTQMSQLGLTPESAGSISGPAPRPQDYTQPIADMVAPFVPIPGLGAAGRIAESALTRAPWLTGAVAGAAGFASPSLAGGEEERSRVMDLQQKMREAGFYNGPIDGSRGPETKAAEPRFQEWRQRQQQDEMERARLQSETERAAADKARADTERQGMEQRAKERQAGEERLRNMEESVPLFSRALRDYGPAIGTVLGLGAGALTRGKVRSGMEAGSSSVAQKAEDLINSVKPRTDWQGRVGAVNEFWQQGGAGDRVPFVTAPRGKLAFKANPDAVEAASLYPQPGPVRAADVGAMGAFGTEAGVSHYMASEAQQRVDAARDRVRTDPSEANIQELQTAINQATIFESMSRFGLGAAAGYGGLLAKSPTNYSRPSTAGAEAARLRINEKLAPKPRSKRTP